MAQREEQWLYLELGPSCRRWGEVLPFGSVSGRGHGGARLVPGEGAGPAGCVQAPGPACAGRRFLGEACNYRMSYFSSAVLSLIASLELVLLARHNTRGQTHTVSFAGPLLPLLALPQEHLPPCGPYLSHPREQQLAGSRNLGPERKRADGWAGEEEALGSGDAPSRAADIRTATGQAGGNC